MKTLKSQSWTIKNEDNEDDIDIDFTAYSDRVEMLVRNTGQKNIICFTSEQIAELKKILESTKYIFNQYEPRS